MVLSENFLKKQLKIKFKKVTNNIKLILKSQISSFMNLNISVIVLGHMLDKFFLDFLIMSNPP